MSEIPPAQHPMKVLGGFVGLSTVSFMNVNGVLSDDGIELRVQAQPMDAWANGRQDGIGWAEFVMEPDKARRLRDELTNVIAEMDRRHSD